MIWHPAKGMRVRLHYRKGAPRLIAKLHGAAGTVLWAGRGPGPINVEVVLDPPEAQILVTVPRGNLVRAEA